MLFYILYLYFVVLSYRINAFYLLFSFNSNIWFLCVCNVNEKIINVFYLNDLFGHPLEERIYTKFTQIMSYFDPQRESDWEIVLVNKTLNYENDSGIAVCAFADFHLCCVTDYEINDENVNYYRHYVLLSLYRQKLTLFE